MLSMGADGPRVNNAVGVALLIFAMIIIRCLISGVIMVILYDSVITPDFTKSLSYVTRLLPSLVLNYIIFIILVGIGLMVYVIPGLILLTFFALYEQIILFEQERGVASLGKSFSMAKQAFFAIFTIVVFCLVVRYVPIYLLQTIETNWFWEIFGWIKLKIFINTITIALYQAFMSTVKLKTMSHQKLEE